MDKSSRYTQLKFNVYLDLNFFYFSLTAYRGRNESIYQKQLSCYHCCIAGIVLNDMSIIVSSVVNQRLNWFWKNLKKKQTTLMTFTLKRSDLRVITFAKFNTYANIFVFRKIILFLLHKFINCYKPFFYSFLDLCLQCNIKSAYAFNRM